MVFRRSFFRISFFFSLCFSFVVLLSMILAAPARAMENMEIRGPGSDMVPSYFRVFDVGASGSLKIRSEPVAGGMVIGEYALDAGPVEILKIVDGWGYVIAGEGNGWVNMSHLLEIPVPRVGRSQLPEGLVCIGNEPFWNIEISAETIAYSRLDEVDQDFSIIEAGGYDGRAGADGFVQASGVDSILYALVSARQCSDGMSDRNYGWWVNLLRTSASGTNAVTGCCSISVN